MIFMIIRPMRISTIFIIGACNLNNRAGLMG